jgi:DNA-binding NarL/FixJ family response regulator
VRRSFNPAFVLVEWLVLLTRHTGACRHIWTYQLSNACLDCPHLILALLSRTASAGYILSYLAAGATGYILEESGHAEVERAVREILNGAIYIPPNVIEPTAYESEFALAALRRNRCRLTPRQNAVLGLLLRLFQQGHRPTAQFVSTHSQNPR